MVRQQSTEEKEETVRKERRLLFGPACAPLLLFGLDPSLLKEEVREVEVSVVKHVHKSRKGGRERWRGAVTAEREKKREVKMKIEEETGMDFDNRH